MKQVPISDGGEGFLESVELALSHKSGTGFAQSPGTLERIPIEVVGPFANEAPRASTFLLDHETNTAFLEVAQYCGLELVPGPRRNPYLTSSAVSLPSTIFTD